MVNSAILVSTKFCDQTCTLCLDDVVFTVVEMYI